MALDLDGANKKITALEEELKAAKQANARLRLANQELDARQRVFLDTPAWPKAIQYILGMAPWNFIKVIIHPFESEHVNVEIRPMKFSFQQGDCGIIVPEEDFSESKTYK